MDTDKITQLIRRHYAEYQQAHAASQMALIKLQAVAEAAEMTAEQVNAMLGINLFSDKEGTHETN